MPTAATNPGELNPEQRRGVEHGVRQDCTIRPPLLLVAGADLEKPTLWLNVSRTLLSTARILAKSS